MMPLRARGCGQRRATLTPTPPRRRAAPRRPRRTDKWAGSGRRGDCPLGGASGGGQAYPDKDILLVHRRTPIVLGCCAAAAAFGGVLGPSGAAWAVLGCITAFRAVAWHLPERHCRLATAAAWTAGTFAGCQGILAWPGVTACGVGVCAFLAPPRFLCLPIRDLRLLVEEVCRLPAADPYPPEVVAWLSQMGNPVDTVELAAVPAVLTPADVPTSECRSCGFACCGPVACAICRTRGPDRATLVTHLMTITTAT